jgi:non-ribosomal peptide synthetase component E (peptide arylation enzyme)
MTSDWPDISAVYPADRQARFRASAYWRDETPIQWLDRVAAEQGDKLFVTDGTKALTYSQVRAQAYAVAAQLRRRGVRQGDRVAIQLPNWAEFIVAAVAVTRLRAVIVPILPIYRSAEARYVLEHAGARVVIAPEVFRRFEYAAMYRDIARSTDLIRDLIIVRGSVQDDSSFETLAAAPAGVPEDEDLGAPPSGDDAHIIVYTSGTESRPKGCCHTFNTLAYSVHVMQTEHQWTPADVAFGPSPVGHSTGYVTSYLLPLVVGAGSHLMDVWDPARALREIEEHRCTTTTTATAFLRMAVDAFADHPADVSSMRVWVAAGAPIPDTVIAMARKAFVGCEILSHYGRSENMVTTTCAVGVAPEKVASSDGRPAQGTEIAIVDVDGRPLPTGEVGDIAYRGPGHMLGYYRDERRTADLFTPAGFSRSGDLGYADADGYVRVSGRLKDIIIRGGMNISAREIEDYLLTHPSVADVAVVAMPSERLGEQACAFVVPTPGATVTLAEICTFLREERGIAMQKLPEHLELIDVLPTTATGKVQKYELRERAKLIAGTAP